MRYDAPGDEMRAEFAEKGYLVFDEPSSDLVDWAITERQRLERLVERRCIEIGGGHDGPLRINAQEPKLNKYPPIAEFCEVFEKILQHKFSEGVKSKIREETILHWQISSALAGFPGEELETNYATHLGAHVDGVGGRPPSYILQAFINK